MFTDSGRTLIILNPHAGSGRAGKVWGQIEPLLWKELGELTIAVTQRPQDVAEHLDKARAAGLTRVIAIGGDGTNHALINELVRLNNQDPDGPKMTFGNLPVGTGRDWARALGIPFSPVDAVKWIKSAHPTPLDVGRLRMIDAEGANAGQPKENYFLNIGSVGISGMISQQVNRLALRRPWTFYKASVESLLRYRPPKMIIKLDGKVWYEGRTYIVAVANGRLFGRGMLIAPEAKYDDGLFDVILVEGMPRLEAIRAMNTIYTGDHLKRKDVHSARAKSVEIQSDTLPIGFELDGESGSSGTLTFDILPQALSVMASMRA